MKLSFKFAASLTAIVVILAPQITLARTPAEAKYLASIDRLVNIDKNLSRTHASIPTNHKLQYGYQVCRALDQGATMSDLRAIMLTGNFTVNETSYFRTMRVLAVLNLCPEHEPLLNT